MRHITRPLVQWSFRALAWRVTWPDKPGGLLVRDFPRWDDALLFARSVA